MMLVFRQFRRPSLPAAPRRRLPSARAAATHLVLAARRPTPDRRRELRRGAAASSGVAAEFPDRACRADNQESSTPASRPPPKTAMVRLRLSPAEKPDRPGRTKARRKYQTPPRPARYANRGAAPERTAAPARADHPAL